MTVYNQTVAPVYTVDNVFIETQTNDSTSYYNYIVYMTPTGNAQAKYYIAATDTDSEVSSTKLHKDLAKDAFIANARPLMNTFYTTLCQVNEAPTEKDWRS
jgi:hypothetical protein|tara:strand:+ start:7907 stop:8209 length:303 start_codon:yes stop_codon:yes gene_type:complete